MGKVGKITSIKHEYSSSMAQTLVGSLAREGYTRIPGTGKTFVPYKEKNGEYRTGLDPNALYIKQLEKLHPEEAEQEKARVTDLKAELEAMAGFDLGPRSDYYTKMYDDEFGQPTRAKLYKMLDGVNIFRFDDLQDAITYAWLRVHPEIAPSHQAYLSGRIKNVDKVQHFIDDEDFETEIAYKQKTLINKAIATLDGMNPDRQKKVAKLLGLPVSHNTKESVVYNTIDTFIKESTQRDGNKSRNLDLFNKVVSMADENLNIRYLVKEAFHYNIYRLKNGLLYEGQNEIAKDEEEWIGILSSPRRQEDLIALEEKVKTAKLADA